MGAALRHVQQLIRLGYFNRPCSTEVDVEMAEQAIINACHIDREERG